MHTFTLPACLTPGQQIKRRDINGVAALEAIGNRLQESPSTMCVRGGPEGPVQRDQLPGGAVRPEKCQGMSSGVKRGQSGLGYAQASARKGRQGHGCFQCRRGPGEGNAASS